MSHNVAAAVLLVAVWYERFESRGRRDAFWENHQYWSRNVRQAFDAAMAHAKTDNCLRQPSIRSPRQTLSEAERRANQKYLRTSGADKPVPVGERVERVRVPRSMMGRFIGQSGQHIWELRRATGATIWMEAESASPEGHAVFAFQGTPASVGEAVARTENLICRVSTYSGLHA